MHFKSSSDIANTPRHTGHHPHPHPAPKISNLSLLSGSFDILKVKKSFPVEQLDLALVNRTKKMNSYNSPFEDFCDRNSIFWHGGGRPGHTAPNFSESLNLHPTRSANFPDSGRWVGPKPARSGAQFLSPATHPPTFQIVLVPLALIVTSYSIKFILNKIISINNSL